MSSHSTPIAVVGLEGIFPGSTSTQGFWRSIVEGQDLISDVPHSHWLVQDYCAPVGSPALKTWTNKGGFLEDIKFDPLEFGLPPTLLAATDTVQLLSLVVAKRLVEGVESLKQGKLGKDKVSVILGVAATTELICDMNAKLQRPIWQKSLLEAGIPAEQADAICQRIEDHYPAWTEATFPGLLGNVVAGRIANRLDLGGTNCVVDAACASSLGAVTMAIQELMLGHADMVLTGGSDALNNPFMHMCFTRTPALSKKGDCRPFSDSADGTLLGEGVGMLALRRLEDAERDGDRIYGVIKGFGSSSDGKAKSVYAPDYRGQARAIAKAYDMAGYRPSTVELVEAHGTATAAGDKAEFEGLNVAFSGADKQSCALGSIKSQIGHTKAAAGAASLVKAVMALHHKVFPPTIKVDKPSSRMAWDESPFYLNTETRPWVGSTEHNRRAGVSSFGFGGSNFHLTVEEYQGPSKPKKIYTGGDELFIASGDSLEELRQELLSWPESLKDLGLAQHAQKAQLSFDAGKNYRIGFVSSEETYASLRSDVLQALDLKNWDEMPSSVWKQVGRTQGDLAWVFPGQGSQYVNMGRDLACNFDSCLDVWSQARKLGKVQGQPVDRFVYPPAVFDQQAAQQQDQALKATDVAQPAIGLMSLGLTDMLQSLGLKPKHVAGHSYGELTALYASGCLGRQDFIHLSFERGRLLKEAAKTPGAMLAVKASVVDCQRVLQNSSLDVQIANYNSPAQQVLAGTIEAIAKANELFKSAGLLSIPIPVATAFHSPIVADAVAPFRQAVDSIALNQASCHAYSNVTGQVFPAEAGRVKDLMASQIEKPVKFTQQLQAMYRSGARVFLEVGPGRVLTSLVKKSIDDPAVKALSVDLKGKNGIHSLWSALGQLSVLGYRIDFTKVWSEYDLPMSTSTQSAATTEIRGSNYGRKYPPKDLEDYTFTANSCSPGLVDSSSGSESVTPEIIQGDMDKCLDGRCDVNSIVASEGNCSMDSKDKLYGLFEDMQNKMTLAHDRFQDTMSSAHSLYLSKLTDSFQALVGTSESTGESLSIKESQVSQSNSPLVSPEPLEVSPAEEKKPQLVVEQEVARSESVQVQEEIPAPAPSSQASEQSALAKDLLRVVAEKTGYPQDMLSLDWELESGLGIDSIKRVEIMSELGELYPSINTIDPALLSAASTLREILELEVGQQASTPAAAPVSEAVQRQGASVKDVRNDEFTQDLLKIVAEKTGYPEEMIDMKMELEAGLGIDSIKRVEILSALQEKYPNLASEDAAVMSQLQTLEEIVAQHENAAAPKKKVLASSSL